MTRRPGAIGRILERWESARGRGPASERLLLAVYCGVLHLALTLLIKAFDFAALAGAGEYLYHPLRPPFTLPLLLGEELVVAFILCAGLYALAGRPATRAAGLVVIGAYQLFLAVDQAFYKYFFSHLHFGLYRETHELGGLASSIFAGVDWQFVVVLAAALAVSVAPWLRWRPGIVRRLADRISARPTTALAGGLIYLGVTCWAVLGQDQAGLERSFAIQALSSAMSGRVDIDAYASGGEWFADAPLHGTPAPPEDFSAIRAALDRQAEPLNLVVYVTESAAYRETSLDPRNRHDTTPVLARLAAEGLAFTEIYTQYPGSTRANFAITTGLTPYFDDSSDIGKYARVDVETLFDVLAEEGYRTALFSSTDTWYEDFDTFMIQHAFDEFVDVNRLTDEQKRGVFSSSWGVEDEVTIDLALEWIARERQRKNPFFVYYIATYPHHPYRLPDSKRRFMELPWDNRGARDGYQGCLNYADAMIGRFHDGLARLGVADRTLFVATVDHGEAFADLHRGNRFHSGYVYEENSHLFAVLHNPAALGPPLRSRRLGTQSDLLPTVLDALRIRRELPIHGRSLIAAEYPERPVFLNSREQLGVRDGHLKFVWNKEEDRAAIYDLSRDPDEQRDVASRYADAVGDYKGRLVGWRDSIEELFEDLQDGARVDGALRRTLNEVDRRAVFGESESLVDEIWVCRREGADDCERPGGVPVFDGTEPLVVKLRWVEAGKPCVFVLMVYDPDDERIYFKRLLEARPGKTSVSKLKLDLPLPEGRYEVIVLAHHHPHRASFEVER